MGKQTPQARPCENPDAREIFLERASARLLLVEAGAMRIDEAINGLVPSFHEITALPPCACARDIFERMERYRPRTPWRGKR